MNGLIDFTKKHAATILTWLGATGVVATSVLAVKATPEAMKIIEEKRKELPEGVNDLTPYDKFKAAWKPYIPSVMTGLGTISCIFGANIVNKRTQASLISSYALLSKYFNEYRHEAHNTYKLEEGKNANQVIQKSLFEKKIKTDPPKDIFVDDDEMLVYLPTYATSHFNDGYITTKKSTILNLEKRINDEINKEGYVCFNRIYKWLGIKDSKLPAWGWQYGFVKPYDVSEEDHERIEYYGDPETYKVSIELTKCTLDDNSMDCWFLDTICPPEMQSFC